MFTTLDLGATVNTGIQELPHLDSAGRAAVAALSGGQTRLGGVPFRLAPTSDSKRYVCVDRKVEIPVGEQACYVVIAQFCLAASDGRPATRPGDPEPDFLAFVGQRVATVSLQMESGQVQEQPIRVGLEVDEPYSGLEPVVFLALSDRHLVATDWRGPHLAQRNALFGPPGSSSMAALPGSWGVNQGGVVTNEDDAGARYWLLPIELEARSERIVRLAFEPYDGVDTPLLYIAGITLARGREDPFAYRPRETLRIEGSGVEHAAFDIDLGVLGLRRRAVLAPAADWVDEPFVGWGAEPNEAPQDCVLLDVAGTRDATIQVEDQQMSLGSIYETGSMSRGGVSIKLLPTSNIPLRVQIIAGDTGRPTPSRVHFQSADGRYLPPTGHRREVNPGLMEDYGSDLSLGGVTYAYVPGTFVVEVPPGDIFVEVAKGFEYRPVRLIKRIDGTTGDLEIRLDRALDLRSQGWVTADTHVHFVPPTSLMLQAQAEALNLVNLLATQWGELFTNIGDQLAGPVVDDDSETEVRIGSENRMHLLGHVTLLGANERIFPLGTGGGMTSPLGDPVHALIADLAERNREAGGIAIAAHFPFPYGEVTADIVLGKLDAIELFGLARSADGPRTRAWYRFLNAGYRVPIVGGTDKMSAGTAVGAVRTYARLGAAQPFSFVAWADAVRSGRTFLTSGPLLELDVEGHGPGDVLRLPASGGTAHVHAAAHSVNRLETLEIVVNGRVVASARSNDAGHSATIDDSIRLPGPAWIAARCTSPDVIYTAFPTSVGAHTSPVYVECGARPLLDMEDAQAVLRLIEAAHEWATRRAIVQSEADRARFRMFFEQAARSVQDRIAAAN
jgi:hypothetical protein